VSTEDIFGDYNSIAKRLVKQFSDNELNLNTEKNDLLKLFSTIKEKVKLIDKNLEKSVNAEEQKTINSFSNLEDKILRAEKKQHETTLSQLEKVKDKVFPNGTLQERHDNFLPLYTRLGKTFFEDLLKEFNSFEKEIYIFKH